METTEKEYSKLQWFLFVVIIPSIFTILLVIVLLSVAGFNTVGAMKDFAEKIPVISSIIKKDGSDFEAVANEAKATINELEAEIGTKQEKIKILENELDTKENEILSLKSEIDNLSGELQDLEDQRLIKSKKIEELTKMYELMSPKNAALIIPNLKEDEAREILSSLKTDKLAAILEKMSPEDAARFTALLTR